MPNKANVSGLDRFQPRKILARVDAFADEPRNQDSPDTFA